MVGSAACRAVENEIFISALYTLGDCRAHVGVILFAGQDYDIPSARSVPEGIEIAYDKIGRYAEVLKIPKALIGGDNKIALPYGTYAEEVSAADYMTNFVHVITVRPFL